jgi:fructose 1,6-bisphosphatase
MDKFKLGSDVYLEFKVTVGKHRALINSVIGEVHKGDKYLRDFATSVKKNTVSGIIDNSVFTRAGNYNALFTVHLQGMGKQEYNIPFEITKSVFGKARQ